MCVRCRDRDWRNERLHFITGVTFSGNVCKEKSAKQTKPKETVRSWHMLCLAKGNQSSKVLSVKKALRESAKVNRCDDTFEQS